VLHGGPDPPTERERVELGEILPIVDPQHISGITEATNLKSRKFVCLSRAGGPKETIQK